MTHSFYCLGKSSDGSDGQQRERQPLLRRLVGSEISKKYPKTVSFQFGNFAQTSELQPDLPVASIGLETKNRSIQRAPAGWSHIYVKSDRTRNNAIFAGLVSTQF